MAGRFSNLEFDEEREPTHKNDEIQPFKEVSAESYLAKADEEYHWGYFDSALRLYTQALQEDRSTIAAWVGQVQMLVQLGECHEARLWSDKALELFRNNGQLLAAKAQACIRLHDFKAASACSDGALQAQGTSPWRWEVRGELLLAKGEKHFGDCFQKALAEPTADWFDRVVIGRIYLYYHRMTNALNYLQQAVELQPTHGYVWLELGQCQKALALDSLAATSYGRCLDLRPDCEDAQEALNGLKSNRSFSSWILGHIRRWRHA